jgi:hypothetical protein
LGSVKSRDLTKTESPTLATTSLMLFFICFQAARLALCQELASHVIGNQTMLEHQQFDLVFRLINAALQVSL